MNLHQRRQHYDTVECSGRKPRVNVQCCAGYRMCFAMRGIVLCKSCDVDIVQDAGSVNNTGRKENGGVGRKKGYIYSCSCDLISILRIVGRLVNQNKTAQPSSSTITKHFMIEEPGDRIQYSQ